MQGIVPQSWYFKDQKFLISPELPQSNLPNHVATRQPSAEAVSTRRTLTVIVWGLILFRRNV